MLGNCQPLAGKISFRDVFQRRYLSLQKRTPGNLQMFRLNLSDFSSDHHKQGKFTAGNNIWSGCRTNHIIPNVI